MRPGLEQRAGEIFLAATSLAGEERVRFLAAEAGGDADLHAEVISLLAADERNGAGFMNEPALGRGFSVMSPGVGADAADEALAPGRIGPYHTLRVLGQSDDVIVWLAEQREPVERRVAIKVLRSGAARREVQKRFELERRAVALMEHPNIARLYDAGTTPDGRAYFAMEHVDGAPITDACARMELRQRLGLFVQSCLGVEHAHQRGIVHRDLKPANLMVSRPDGGEASLKVIDFGVAAAIRMGLEERTGATLQGQVLGTLGYMAPERFSGASHASGQLGDVYALGAVLYEMLAGRPAFALDGRGTAAAIAAILNEQPARLGQVDRALRGDLEAIVATAMKAEPGERYQSVSELRRDVERYLGARPVMARMPGPAYIASRFVARHRVLTAVCGAAVVVAAAAMWQVRSAEQSRLELAAEIAGSWLDQTVRMARTIGERDKRRPLLERLARESQRFELLAPGDVRIQKIHAAVLGSLGDVAQEEADLARAGALMAEALSVRQQIVGLAPDDLDAQMDLSIAMVRCGDTTYDLGDSDAGASWHRRAMERDRAILERAPNNVRAISNLAWSYHRLGARAISNRELNAAEELLNRGLVLMETLTRIRGSVDDVRGLADMYTQLGYMAAARGDTASQRRYHEASRNAAASAQSMAPENRLAGQQWLRSKINCLWETGEDEAGRPSGEAWPLLLDEMRRFVQRDPSDRDSQVLMMVAYNNALLDAGRMLDSGAMTRLESMLEADLATVLPDRPEDKELSAARVYVREQAALVRHNLGDRAGPPTTAGSGQPQGWRARGL